MPRHNGNTRRRGHDGRRLSKKGAMGKRPRTGILDVSYIRKVTADGKR